MNKTKGKKTVIFHLAAGKNATFTVISTKFTVGSRL